MYKKSFLALTIFTFVTCSCSFQQEKESKVKTINFQADTVSLIRNPGMGWTVYDDANDAVANADNFWAKQDSIARKYASVLYIRWRWSDMEPKEGHYAWKYDENFKKLVQGAIDRGLRLAFRIYVESQDNLYDATPAFVFDAGAQYFKGAGLNGRVRSPYPDDPIFQEKFSNFVRAFAKEFDNPTLVNYVDGYNLGWWGEGDHLTFKNWENTQKTFEWITSLYGNAFKKVPLVIAVDSQIGHDMELKYAIEGQGYAIRRDGYASYWMPERQHKLIRELFPKSFVVSECCYWQDRKIEVVNQIDKKYSWKSWGEYYCQVTKEALATHANYLDLREPLESHRWIKQAKKQVLKFIQKGGYRIFPNKINYKIEDDTLTIQHSWSNLGVGILPNNNKRWDYKYKVTFALLDVKNQPVQRFVSSVGEPSDWIDGKRFIYNESFSVKKVKKGDYQLVVGIQDSTNLTSFINLAVKKQTKQNWVIIDKITLK